MKRLASLLICLMMLGSSAMADIVINGGENRGINPPKAEPNVWEDVRISPTTGLVLSEVAKKAPEIGRAHV